MHSTLLDRLLELPLLYLDKEEVPPALLVAFTVVTARRLNGLKQSTLADLSGVSLSTIERVERGQPVSPSKLDQIGVGLGYEPGYFTAPRKPVSPGEAQQGFAESYAHLAPVILAPIETHDQVRGLIRCEAVTFQSFAPDVKIPELTETLYELLDAGSFLSGRLSPAPKKGGRRRYYDTVLEHVRMLGRDGYWLLAGVVEPGDDLHSPPVRTAVIAISAKAGDPAGGNKRLMMADVRRRAGLPRFGMMR